LRVWTRKLGQEVFLKYRKILLLSLSSSSGVDYVPHFLLDTGELETPEGPRGSLSK
jgi:hypothetical protein